MKLKRFLKLHYELTGQRQSTWAADNNLPPCLMTRALRGDKLSLINSVKIHRAAHGQVPILELAPWLKELLPDYKPE